jgi:peptide deformylase
MLILCVACQRSTSAGFDVSQVARITAADARTPMRVWKITSESDSLLLRQAAEPIQFKKEDPILDRFIDRLFATVRDSMSLGVGIAAPQVGILKQIIWVQRFDKEGLPFEVYLNPTIVTYSEEKREGIEGCLSIPNRQETCLRSEWIEMAYNKQDGSRHQERVEGFTAVIFQHEIDHLNGILYLDHLSEHQSKP